MLAIAAALFCSLAGGQGVVNVYSARHYDTDRTLYDQFTAETGIEVNLLEASS
ncbi:MAG: Fe(3+) ABC transporter substrate-binding protein, partial [Planctomycetota bacterium]